MQSFRAPSMRRLWTTTTSLRLAPRMKPLPALLSCHAQLFSTSPLVRAYNAERGPRHEYRNDRTSNRPMPAPFPPCSTLYISNLPWEATAQDIEAALEEFEGVQRITFGTLPDGRSRGFAHVQFTSEAHATAVFNAHRESPFNFGEREIRISYGKELSREGGFKKDLEPSPSLYIGSLPYHATEQDVTTVLGAIGELSSVRIGRDRDGTPKGYAHVDFTSTAEAERVLEHYKSQPIRIQDRDIRLDRTNPPVHTHPPSPRLYYTGFSGDESALRGSLGDFGGQIQDIYILRNPGTGEPTGAGFIQFEDTETATQAKDALNGTFTDGVKFGLEFAKLRSENTSRGERGSGGRFGLKSHRGRSDEGGRSGGSREGTQWENNRKKPGTWEEAY